MASVINDRQRPHRLAVTRAVVAGPAMVGSLLLLVVLFGWAGPEEGPLLLAWLAIGIGALTAPGERAGLRCAGFRRMSDVQRSLIESAHASALTRCGVKADAIDLYVIRDAVVGARAAGRRSVAVSAGLLHRLATGQIAAADATAILSRAVTQLAARTDAYGLMRRWYSWPWRAGRQVLVTLTFGTVGRLQPPKMAIVGAATVVGVAIVQAVHQQHWATVTILAAITVFGVACPLANEAINKRERRAVDELVVRAVA